MIHSLKKLDPIKGPYISKAPQVLGAPVEGTVRALSDSVCIGIGDELALKEWFDDIAQGMMHHPVAKGSR
jgi:hypothetical protein